MNEELELDFFNHLIKDENLLNEARLAKTRSSYALDIDEIIEQLRIFYSYLLLNGSISLSSTNIHKYRRGWLMRADLDKISSCLS